MILSRAGQYLDLIQIIRTGIGKWLWFQEIENGKSLLSPLLISSCYVGGIEVKLTLPK